MAALSAPPALPPPADAVFRPQAARLRAQANAVRIRTVCRTGRFLPLVVRPEPRRLLVAVAVGRQLREIGVLGGRQIERAGALGGYGADVPSRRVHAHDLVRGLEGDLLAEIALPVRAA